MIKKTCLRTTHDIFEYFQDILFIVALIYAGSKLNNISIVRTLVWNDNIAEF